EETLESIPHTWGVTPHQRGIENSGLGISAIPCHYPSFSGKYRQRDGANVRAKGSFFHGKGVAMAFGSIDPTQMGSDCSWMGNHSSLVRNHSPHMRNTSGFPFSTKSAPGASTLCSWGFAHLDGRGKS